MATAKPSVQQSQWRILSIYCLLHHRLLIDKTCRGSLCTDVVGEQSAYSCQAVCASCIRYLADIKSSFDVASTPLYTPSFTCHSVLCVSTLSVFKYRVRASQGQAQPSVQREKREFLCLWLQCETFPVEFLLWSFCQLTIFAVMWCRGNMKHVYVQE